MPTTAAPTEVASHDNPLCARTGLPRFDQVKPEHVIPAVKQAIAEAEAALDAIESSLTGDAEPTWDSLIVPFMRLADELE